MPEKAEFVASVFEIENLPAGNLPEIVFAGKSNVGKSSMINSLLNNRLANVSNTPGRTQSINYYLVHGAYYFVDLPGYGFSRTSPDMKEKWAELISRYFETGRDIRAVFQIVDIRHKPKEKDLELAGYLKSMHLHSVIVCSKADKLSNIETCRNIKLIRDTLPIDAEFIAYSSQTGLGRNKILALIKNLITP